MPPHNQTSRNATAEIIYSTFTAFKPLARLHTIIFIGPGIVFVLCKGLLAPKYGNFRKTAVRVKLSSENGLICIYLLVGVCYFFSPSHGICTRVGFVGHGESHMLILGHG